MWGALARWTGRRLGREPGGDHRWIWSVKRWGRGVTAGRSHAVEAFEWLFKKRGLHPVGFQQIFVDCSLMTDTLSHKVESRGPTQPQHSACGHSRRSRTAAVRSHSRPWVSGTAGTQPRPGLAVLLLPPHGVGRFSCGTQVPPSRVTSWRRRQESWPRGLLPPISSGVTPRSEPPWL